MKYSFLFFLLILGFAVNTNYIYAFTYSRNPLTNSNLSQLTVNVSGTDINDICGPLFGQPGPNYNAWVIELKDPFTGNAIKSLYSQIYSDSDLNVSYTFYFDTIYSNIIFIRTVCSNDNFANPIIFYFNGEQLEVIDFPGISTIVYIPPPPENINAVWGSAGLFGTSTNLLAAVTTGVVDTGVNIWPLFLFVGVALAFVIAIKVQNFIMAAGDKERSETKEDKPTKKRYARSGEYKAYKRGKKNNPGLWDD